MGMEDTVHGNMYDDETLVAWGTIPMMVQRKMHGGLYTVLLVLTVSYLMAIINTML